MGPDVNTPPPEFIARERIDGRLVLLGITVGLLAGATASLFRVCLEKLSEGRELLPSMVSDDSTGGTLVLLFLGTVMPVIGVLLVRRFARETSGSGIPEIEDVVSENRSIRWARVLLVKFTSSLFSVGSGLVLGREGPTVQMGGAWGEAVSRFKRPEYENKLIAAGAGAGLAAAFNAPFAGMIFVIEELKRRISAHMIVVGFLACATAVFVQQALLGPKAAIVVPLDPYVPSGAVPWMLLVGLIAGVVGAGYNRALVAAMRFGKRINPLIRAGAVGLVVTLVAVWYPHAGGEGHAVVESALVDDPHLQMAIVLLLIRFAFSVISYASGVSGGIFAPLLSLGALLGLISSDLVGAVHTHPEASVAAFAVVGMAALFAAVVRAPLTGIVLVVEMTGEQTLMLPLVLASAVSYAVAEWLKTEPIYETLGRMRDEERLAEEASGAPTS